MRFFLLAPYDFGASFKIIKMGGKISSDFPFKKISLMSAVSYIIIYLGYLIIIDINPFSG